MATQSEIRNGMILSAYMKAVNEIDDYFEYRNESEKDKKAVHDALLNLEKRLMRIKNG